MPEPRDNPICRLAQDATDQQAWAAVVERYGGVCWRIALRMLGDRDAAADAVQDCLLAVRSAAPRFAPGEDAEGAAMAWVARVAVNTCHASRRRQRPTVRLPLQIAAPAPAPVAADDDLLAHLREAIAQLPTSLREAVSLRYLAGCDNAAVATALAIEPGTARVRIHRAIEALRTLLGRRGVALPAVALVGLLDGVARAAEPPLPAAMVQQLIAVPAPAAAGGLSAGLLAVAAGGAALMLTAATWALWPAERASHRPAVVAPAPTAPAAPSAPAADPNRADPRPTPAWRELFPASGLDGWTPVRGSWSREGALVVGAWGADGRGPRLVSAAPLAWDELSCRLRVLDQREMLAEIQLDDYRLFFTVPAEGGRWHDLRLQRRPGAEPVCTCDGRELVPEYEQAVGTPGLLAFYTRGARIEIADARLRLESP